MSARLVVARRGHAGIVNTVHHAQAITGTSRCMR
jgi:hypothetical protein